MAEIKLKVVHICTYLEGGAGRAAYRIHEALLKSGIKSSFVTIQLHQQVMKSESLSKANHESFIDRQFNRIQFRLKKHLGIVFKNKEQRKREKKYKYYSKFNEIKVFFDCEIATLPFTDYNILDNPVVKEADIIHLHWIGEMVDYPTFFKNNTKPIVWTLHDMNPFQGLFHYRNDEIRNRNGIEKFDTEIQTIKKKAINSGSSELILVTPSKWLQDETLNNNTFKNFKSHYIPYPISNCFWNIQKADMKTRSEGNNAIFLFISQGVKVWRKGFDLLIESLKKVNISSFTLFVIGEVPEFHIADPHIRWLGTIKENRKLIEYFSIANAVIIPSREDNLPNVMLESFACGTPVIGFPVGGIKEHVIDFKTGLLAEKISGDSLARTIEKFYVNREKFDSQVIRNYANKHFKAELIAEKYLNLYKQLLKN